MGWTWGGRADVALQAQPAIANIPELVARWPGMREAVAAMAMPAQPAQPAQPPAAPPPAGGGQAQPQ